MRKCTKSRTAMQNHVWKENCCERWSGFYGLVAWPPFLRRCAAGESLWAHLQGQFLEGAITETDLRRAATVEKSGLAGRLRDGTPRELWINISEVKERSRAEVHIKSKEKGRPGKWPPFLDCLLLSPTLRSAMPG